MGILVYDGKRVEWKNIEKVWLSFPSHLLY